MCSLPSPSPWGGGGGGVFPLEFSSFSFPFTPFSPPSPPSLTPLTPLTSPLNFSAPRSIISSNTPSTSTLSTFTSFSSRFTSSSIGSLFITRNTSLIISSSSSRASSLPLRTSSSNSSMRSFSGIGTALNSRDTSCAVLGRFRATLLSARSVTIDCGFSSFLVLTDSDDTYTRATRSRQ